jgi:hypothetical protein
LAFEGEGSLGGLEEGVDEGGGAGAAEADEGGDEAEDEDDRGEPPLRVVEEEISELGEDAAGGALGFGFKRAGLVVLVGHGEAFPVDEAAADGLPWALYGFTRNQIWRK